MTTIAVAIEHEPIARAAPSTASAIAANERLHALDAVRGGALTLGVVLHASLSYLPGAGDWWIVGDASSTTLAVVFHTAHMFRMTLFFVLAGLFARMAYHRLGLRGFARDRIKRIAMPLLIGWPLVFAGIIAAVVWSALYRFNGTLPENPPPGPAFTPDDFPLTHLWFLYVLLLFYAGAIGVRGTIAALDRTGRLRGAIDRLLRAVVGLPLPIVFAAPTCIALTLHAGWMPWFGIPTPDQSLYPNVPALVGYGGAFAFGWLLQRQLDLLQTLRQRWTQQLAAALLCSVICLALAGTTPALATEPSSALRLAYAAAYALGGWCWTFALLGLALRWCDHANPARRYLADASYWIYLVHLPLVMLLQVAASRIDLPWPIEFPLLLAVAFAVMLASYHGCVRHTLIGEALNGKRRIRSA